MTGVRNGVLCRTQTTALGGTTVAVVPAGFTWLVKHVLVMNNAGAACNANVTFESADGTVRLYLTTWSLPAFGHDEWSGWTAMGPGDKFIVGTDQLGTGVWVSGADLPGVIA